jgi:hypothetical protein
MNVNNNQLSQLEQQQKLNQYLENSSPVTCDKCGFDIFSEGIFLRELSPIITGKPHASFLPVPAQYCIKCYHVNDAFKHPALKSKIKLA